MKKANRLLTILANIGENLKSGTLGFFGECRASVKLLYALIAGLDDFNHLKTPLLFFFFAENTFNLALSGKFITNISLKSKNTKTRTNANILNYRRKLIVWSNWTAKARIIYSS